MYTLTLKDVPINDLSGDSMVFEGAAESDPSYDALKYVIEKYPSINRYTFLRLAKSYTRHSDGVFVKEYSFGSPNFNSPEAKKYKDEDSALNEKLKSAEKERSDFEKEIQSKFRVKFAGEKAEIDEKYRGKGDSEDYYLAMDELNLKKYHEYEKAMSDFEEELFNKYGIRPIKGSSNGYYMARKNPYPFFS